MFPFGMDQTDSDVGDRTENSVQSCRVCVIVLESDLGKPTASAL